MNLKKIIALVLCVCMVLSFFPVSVFAEEWVEDEVVLVDEEEYYEPQDEYYEEEILEEEPADSVEYVEPAEELIEEELVEEPAEEPAAEEPAPAEEPARVEEPAAELETAETFNSGVIIVAECGTKSYTSLQEAIDENAGKTITVVKDCGLDEGAEALNVSNNVIIAGGDHTFTGNVNITADAKISNITFNGTVKVNGGNSEISNATFKADPGVVLNEGALTLQTNLTFEGIYSVKVNGGTLTIPEGETTDFGIIDAASGVSGNVKGGRFGKEMYIPAALIAPGYGWDAGAVVYMGCAKNATTGRFYTTLAEAVSTATAGDEIILLLDVALNATITIDKNLTLDLNGNDITAADARVFWVKSGTVTITGDGTISAGTAPSALDKSSSVIRVGDSGVNAAKASLTIGSGVTVTSPYCYGVTFFGKNTPTIELVINGTVSVTGVQPAISGNGTSDLSATDVLVNSGAVVTATNDNAIYFPGKGTLTVKGTVTGTGGIEAKGGEVVIDGGTVTATATTQSHSVNNNGTSTSGYAIAAIGNDNYVNGPAKFTINSGSAVTGKVIILADAPTDTKTGSIVNNSGTAVTPETGYAWNDAGKLVKLWKVSFYNEPGTTEYTELVEYVKDGEFATKPSNDPHIAGYKFAAWVTEENCPAAEIEAKTYHFGDPEKEADKITADKELYARFTRNRYDLTYDPNGGYWATPTDTKDTDPKVSSLGYNDAVTGPEEVEREGYTFNGWDWSWTDEEQVVHKGEWNGTAIDPAAPEKMPAGDLTFTAHWTINSYPVTFVAPTGGQLKKTDGTIVTDQYTASFDYNAEIDYPTATKDGYTYKNWWNFTDSEQAGATMPAHAIIVNPYMEANDASIVFDAKGGTIPRHDADNEGKLTINGKTDAVIDPAIKGDIAGLTPSRDGYTFTGWYEVGKEEKTLINALDEKFPVGTKNYEAHWTSNKFTVSFEANSGTGNMDAQEFSYQTEEALDANTFTKEGYSFANWTKVATPTDTDARYPVDYVYYADPEDGFVGAPAADGSTTVPLYAQWSANEFKMAFDGNGATSGSMNNLDLTYDVDADLPALGFQRPGYEFVGWGLTPDATTTWADMQHLNAETNVNVLYSNFMDPQTKTVTVYAIWRAINYTLTYEWATATDVPLTTMVVEDIHYGDTLPTEGLPEFVDYWYIPADDASGDTSEPNKYIPGEDKYDVEGDMTLRAHYKVFTATFDANDGEAVEPTQYTAITRADLPATTRDKYTFKGWKVISTSEDGNWTVGEPVMPGQYAQMTGDVEFEAQWKFNEAQLTDGTDNSVPYETIALAKAEYEANSSHYKRGIEILDPDAVYALAHGDTLVVYDPGDWSPVPDETDTAHNYYITKSAADAYGAVTFSATDNVAQLAEIKWTVTRDEEWNYHAVPEINVIGSYADFASAADQAKDQTGNLNPEEAGTYTDLAVILLANNTTPYPLNAGEKLTVLHTRQNYVGGVTGAEGVRAAYAPYDLSMVDDVRADYAFTYTGVQQYTVTFMNGETEHAKFTRDAGESIADSEVPDPTNPAGKTFDNWYNGSSEIEWPYTPTADVTFVAVYTNNSNRITYNANGGTVKNEAGSEVSEFSITADYESAIYAPNKEGDVYREGYDLRGWWPGAGGVIQPAELPTTMPAAETTTYTASWQIQQHTVIFTKEDGTTSVATFENVDYGTLETAPLATATDLVKTGYTLDHFVNIADEDDTLDPGANFTIPASDKTYKAVYTANTFTITLKANSGEGDDVVVNATYDVPVTLASSFTKTGYNYTALTVNSDGTGNSYDNDTELSVAQVNALMPESGSGNTNLYANWVADDVTVHFNSNDGTAVPDFAGKYDGMVTKPDDPTRTGYTFKGWYADEALTTPWTFASDKIKTEGEMTLYAKWDVNTFVFKYVAGDGTGDDYTETVEYDKAATLFNNLIEEQSRFSRTGYNFNGWITATGGEYNPGQNLTAEEVNALYATAVTVGDLKVVKFTAKWDPIVYTITYENVPDDYDGPASYTFETVKPDGLAIPDPSKTGANFKGWTITITNGEDVQTVDAEHDTIPAENPRPGNRVYTARFNTIVAQLTDGSGAVSTYETIAAAKDAYDDNSNNYVLGIEIIDPTAEYKMTEIPQEIRVQNPGEWKPVDKCDYGYIEESDPDTYGAVTFTMKQSVAQVAEMEWTWTRNADWTYTVDHDEYNIIADYATFAEAADAAKNKSGNWTPNGQSGSAIDTIVVMLQENSVAYDGLNVGDTLTVDWTSELRNPKIVKHDGVRINDSSYPNVESAGIIETAHFYTGVQQWTVTFMNGDETYKTVTVDDGKSIQHRSVVDPEVDGKTFVNWFTDGTAIEWPYTPTANVTFVAEYTENENKVIYNANGGTVKNEAGNMVEDFSIVADYESAIYAPNQEGDVVKEGHKLRGWWPGAGEVIQPAELPTTMPAAETTTYTASWQIQQYTVTFTKEDGTTSVESYTEDYDTPETAPAATQAELKKTGYTLTSFVNTEDETDTIEPGAPFTIPASNKTYKAVYTANEFTITLNANNGDTTVEPVVVIATYDQNVTLTETSFVKTGYNYNAFDTKTGGGGTSCAEGAELTAAEVNNLYKSVKNGNVNLYAQWVADEFNIAFNAGTGEGTMEPMTATYDAGTTLTANAFTKTGYSFANWSIGETTFRNKATLTDTQVNALYAAAEDVDGVKTATLTANYKANTYKVTFDKNDADGEETMGALSVVYDGAAVQIPDSAFTYTGYSFTGWNTQADGNGDPYSVGAEVSNLTANLKLYAQWQINTYTIEYANVPEGYEGPASYTVDSVKPDGLEIPDPSKTGANFKGWTITITNGDTVTTVDTPHDTIPATGAILGNRVYTAKFNDYVAQLTNGSGDVTPYETIADARTAYYAAPTSYHGIEIIDPAAVYEMQRVGDEIVVLNPGEWTPVDKCEKGYIVASDPDEFGAVTFTAEQSVAQVANVKWTWTRNADWSYSFDAPVISVVADYATFAEAANAAKNKSGTWTPSGTTGEQTDTVVIMLVANDEPYTGLNAGDVLTVDRTADNYTTKITAHDGVRYDDDNYPSVDGAADLTTFHRYTAVQQYTVTFMNGETEHATFTRDAGASIAHSEVNDPTNPDGKTFVNWYTDGTAIEWPYTPEQNVTFVAVYTNNTNKITYNANGGTVKNEAGSMVSDFSITADYESDIFAPNQEGDVVREGYDLRGWYLPGAGLTQPADLPTTMPAAETTTYTASWQIQQHTVTFTKEDGTTSVVTFEDEDYGTEKTAPTITSATALKKTGYTLDHFVNIADENDTIQPGATFTIPASDKTYKAVYTANKFTITLKANSGEGEDVVVNATYGEAVTLESSFTKTGYNYTALTVKQDGTGNSYDNNAELSAEQVNTLLPRSGNNTNLYANWIPDTFYIAFAAGEGEGTSMNPLQATYDATATLPANTYTKTGHSFANWSIGETTFKNKVTLTAEQVNALYAEATEVGGVKTVTLTANFKANTYKVTFDKNSEDATGATDALSVPYGGGAVTIPASGFTLTGYKLGSWNTKADGNGDTYNVGDEVENLTANLKLYAQWVDDTFDIIFVANNGTEEQVTALEDLTYGSSATLPANEFTKAGAEFQGWAFTADATAVVYADEFNLKAVHTQALYNSHRNEEDGNVYLYGVWDSKVAQVGEVFYATFADAAKAAIADESAPTVLLWSMPAETDRLGVNDNWEGTLTVENAGSVGIDVETLVTARADYKLVKATTGTTTTFTSTQYEASTVDGTGETIYIETLKEAIEDYAMASSNYVVRLIKNNLSYVVPADTPDNVTFTINKNSKNVTVTHADPNKYINEEISGDNTIYSIVAYVASVTVDTYELVQQADFTMRKVLVSSETTLYDDFDMAFSQAVTDDPLLNDGLEVRTLNLIAPMSVDKELATGKMIRLADNGMTNKLVAPEGYRLNPTETETTGVTLYRLQQVYAISYDPAGGVNPDENLEIVSFNPADDPITFAMPTKEHYHGGKWRVGYTDGGTYIATLTAEAPALTVADLNGAITLTAQYEIDTYEVTFLNDDGGPVYQKVGKQLVEVEPQTVNHGAAITAVTPFKEGYKFSGWTKGGAAFDDATPITEATTLNASWTIKTYNIQFWDGDTKIITHKGTYGDLIERPAATEIPVRENYTFDAWYKDKELTELFDFDVETVGAGAVNIYAKYLPVDYTLTLALDGGTLPASWTKGETIKYNVETAAFTLPVPTKGAAGDYEFLGWTDNDNAVVEEFVPANYLRDVTLTAGWKGLPVEIFFVDTLNTKMIANKQLEFNSLVKDGAPTFAEVLKKVGTYPAHKTLDPNDLWVDVTDETRVSRDNDTYNLNWKNLYDIPFTMTGVTFKTVSVMEGDTISESMQPSVKNAQGKQANWLINGEEGNFFFLDKTPVDGTIENLEATWTEPVTYTVTFMDGEEVYDEVPVIAGEKVAKPDDPTKEGWRFVAWLKDGVAFDFDTPINENIMLDASWEEVIVDYVETRYSMNITSSFAINYYVKPLIGEASDYEVSFNGGEYVAVTSGRASSYGYAFTNIGSFNANEMLVTVPVSIRYQGEEVKTEEPSIRGYCDKAFASHNEDLIVKCEAALDYGSSAQEFAGETDPAALANGGTYFDVLGLDVEEVGEVIGEPITGITGAKSSVTMGSEISLNLYVVHSKKAVLSDYTFKLDGKAVDPAKVADNGKMFGIQVGNVKVTAMDSEHTLEVIYHAGQDDEETFAYTTSCLSYLYKANTVGSIAMQKVSYYLYNFYMACEGNMPI